MKMVKKNLHRIPFFMIAACMLMSFTSCSRDTSGATTLKVYLFGNAQNLDKVLDRFYQQTEDTLNTRLDIIWSSGTDHRQRMPLIMSNQEEADLVFDAFWMNLNRLMTQGAYQDISRFFNNDNFPGLKSAFPADYLAQVTRPDGAIYMIPFTQAAEDIQVILLRGDLRQKYGMAPIRSNEDLERYFRFVQADIQSGELAHMVAPFGVGASRAFYYLDDDIIEKRVLNVLNIDGTGNGVGMTFDVAISEDGTTVLGAATLGDPDSAYAMFPPPYNRNTRNYRVVNHITKWAQYAQNDRQTETDALRNLFFAERVAATEANISNYQLASTTLAAMGRSVEMYVYVPAMQRQERIVSQPMTAWNFLCVPRQSRRVEQSMAFIDWIYQSRENHNLFEFGIEGEDWAAVGDYEFRDLDNPAKYFFPGFQMTWNPNFIRINADFPDEVKEVLRYQNDPQTYIPSIIPGFTFNNEATSDLRTAFAAVSGVQATYRPILMHGLAGGPEQTRVSLEEYHSRATGAGLDIIRQAVIDQVQAFLDAR